MSKTLHIRLESNAAFFEQLEADMAALERGGDLESDEDPQLSIDSLSTLARLFRETNLELLESVAEHEPESMREAARIVDRGISEVKTNLDELESYGLIRYEPNGRAKRPVVWYDEIDIDAKIPFHRDDSDSPVPV